MRAVAYIRVSSIEQDESVQRQAIMRYANQNNIDIVKWYVDKGQSGAKKFSERPAASQLLKEIDELKPDLILAWSLDRLGRSMLDTLNTVIELEGRGYRIITVKEEFLQTMDENFRKLIISIMAWFAEFERRRIKERQEEAWRQGKQRGRPKKVSDETIRRYLKRYNGLNLKAIWKIMRSDGHDISYDRLRKRVKQLHKQRTSQS
jgi:DNA invertase Pin-like site-specific DNA recombinase